jgi:hypothetical protein
MKLEWPVQVLSDAYIDTRRLMAMMDQLFPSGDYRARVSAMYFTITTIR